MTYVMKKSISERLRSKSVSELKAIAKRINFPLRSGGVKEEHVQALTSRLTCKRAWEIIAR